MHQHQYIARESGAIITEKLIGDRSIEFLYNRVREHAPSMFRALTSAYMSSLLGYLHFNMGLDQKRGKGRELLKSMGADWQECLDPPEAFTTPRQVFERKIRYWELRPMENDPLTLVSPADAKVLIGTLTTTPQLFIKEKFFNVKELLGIERPWVKTFQAGEFAIFRLTPDKYHYNHLPVSGVVVDTYEMAGRYHSCNPGAVMAIAGLYSKNRRIVTILDTNVLGGSRVGLVAMIEVVALMIGDIVQCYSATRYDAPQPIRVGMFLEKGSPKSLYRPGSSTDILLFQPGTMLFADDLRHNVQRRDVQSRFSSGLQQPLVETDIKVRSTIGRSRIAQVESLREKGMSTRPL
jgi:phosphatidylserine decarboxylase